VPPVSNASLFFGVYKILSNQALMKDEASAHNRTLALLKITGAYMIVRLVHSSQLSAITGWKNKRPV